MRTVGLFEAKQKLSELAEQASSGAEIGITRHGKLIARLVPAQPARTWKEIFADLDEYRKTAKLLKHPRIKQGKEAGRL